MFEWKYCSIVSVMQGLFRWKNHIEIHLHNNLVINKLRVLANWRFHKWNRISSIKYYNVYRALDISYIFTYSFISRQLFPRSSLVANKQNT